MSGIHSKTLNNIPPLLLYSTIALILVIAVLNGNIKAICGLFLLSFP